MIIAHFCKKEPAHTRYTGTSSQARAQREAIAFLFSVCARL
jgi:hypothetical protein